jgi:uncharacterized protein YkwD
MVRALRFAVPLVLAAAVLSTTVQPAAAVPQVTARADAQLADQVLSSLNAIRAAHGLRPVIVSSGLAAAAREHNREMAAAGYFAHASHDGTPFWARIQRYYASTGTAYWSTGENLLWSEAELDATGAMQMWMASPEHRENILAARWRQIGISVVHMDSSAAVFGGGPVTIVTTDFGVRR